MQITSRFIVWTIVAVLILMLPVVMLFSNEVQWGEAIAYSLILLFVGSSYELWQWLKLRTSAYRFAFVAGLTGVLLLGWVNGAVGIIGSENNPANLLYWAVFAVGLTGSLMARFRPREMSLTLFTAAVVQILVPIFALFIWPAQNSWGEVGVIGVFVVNSSIAMLFVVSALLFRRANAY